ncbi:phox (PX) domain-containing protein [Actinidia rufa]|uniref:Phox (PX) domain-containing protein n=1 Tax=Actinidia rufa TaxID=165716 RepID=A0A7J0G117_9ERIC|nr:phox (PX) domain-containing protein [Actinidia rufa]
MTTMSRFENCANRGCWKNFAPHRSGCASPTARCRVSASLRLAPRGAKACAYNNTYVKGAVCFLLMKKRRFAYTLVDVRWEDARRLGSLPLLTSSSVWVNVPAAAFLIVILRYFSLDFEMRRKAAAYNSKPASANIYSQKKPLEGPKPVFEKPDWRRKVNSPVVEDAIDHFTRHIVSEWVTDLWYSRITPDRQGPEELVHIINGVLAEISSRMRNVNLIDLLTRDIINIFCTHLELFRASQAKIEIEQPGSLTFERRDMELKFVMAAENKLHPALFSAEAEHKVLQHLMDGLISFTFKPEDLQCSLFRFIVRELLACAVMRPVLNLASPRFINERIESLVISLNKANKEASAAQVASQSKLNGASRISSDHFSRSVDPSAKGVELDPLLSMDTRSTRSWSSLPSDPQTDDGKGIQRHHSGGEWGDMLDVISRRKTEALAPEHFENMWTKGRHYRRKEGSNQVTEPVTENSSSTTITADDSRSLGRQKEKGGANKINLPDCSATLSGRNDQAMAYKLPSQNNLNISNQSSVRSYVEDDDDNPMHLKEVESESSSSCTCEDEEINNVTGLDSPGTKVWDGKSNRKLSVSHIHHPLESFEGRKTRKTGKGHVQSRLHRTQSGRKRSRLSRQNLDVWQEIERTSFLSGDGQDILNFSKGHVKSEDSSDDSEAEMLGRIYSGTTASSSASSTTIPGSHRLVVNAQKNSLVADSFLTLRCEVLGANIAKSGSETLAVYSISVTDINNNSWSIKRRFRHFEELHRRLKEYTKYNLHLPPKHFLSTQKLLQIPTISGSIEVWDFLSVDSQTYVFLNSISIIQTLSAGTPNERSKKEVQTGLGPADPLAYRREQRNAESTESVLPMKHNSVADASKLNPKGAVHSPQIKPSKEFGKPFEDSGGFNNEEQSNLSLTRKSRKGSEADDLQASSQSLVDAATDPTIPTEWVPPNVSVPILDLVDVIFQLHDGGWIRRKAFWVAKQVLQLGMGDAFDDWLIEKIQVLRRGTVVASGIRKIEQILWPDGIFLTKHPKRQRPKPSGSTPQNSPKGRPATPISSPMKEDIQQWDEQQQKEAERRAKFVHELMIDKAPAALVGLVGRKEYEHCAKDLYFFLQVVVALLLVQSSVGLKHFAFDLLELLLLSAFPEMDYVFRQLHEEKQKFGEFTPN